ncbi:MAG: glycosyltransferase [Bacillus sp. (in: firmicutes)]
MKEKPIRVLHVIADFKKGGVQAEVMWPARLLNEDVVHFDVLLLSDVKGYYEDEFRKYGEIYRICAPQRKNKICRVIALFTDYFYFKKKTIDLLKSLPEYDAIHAHHTTYNAPVLSGAKKVGIPVRIAHCAVNKPEGKLKNRLYCDIYLWMCSFVLNSCATSKLGVTQNAADYVFGKNRGRMIKNPTLDLTRFNPSLYKRENKNILTLLMVGSFSDRKNQSFAVDILDIILRTGQKCVLKLIGYPRSEKEVYFPMLKEKITNLKLEKYVEILPQDSDIPFHMSQSDYLLIPSLQEGLPNVALEAQAMNLPCIISTDVSKDCDCGLCTFLPLSKGASCWADYILEEHNKVCDKKRCVDMSEWDNRKVCDEYLEIWRGNKH